MAVEQANNDGQKDHEWITSQGILERADLHLDLPSARPPLTPEEIAHDVRLAKEYETAERVVRLALSTTREDSAESFMRHFGIKLLPEDTDAIVDHYVKRFGTPILSGPLTEFLSKVSRIQDLQGIVLSTHPENQSLYIYGALDARSTFCDPRDTTRNAFSDFRNNLETWKSNMYTSLDFINLDGNPFSSLVAQFKEGTMRVVGHTTHEPLATNFTFAETSQPVAAATYLDLP